MDLRNRSGGEGNFVELCKHLGDGPAPLGLKSLLHLGERHGWNTGLQGRELFDEFVGNHVTAGGDELSELDEGDTGYRERISIVDAISRRETHSVGIRGLR